jgi:hypothetical protein
MDTNVRTGLTHSFACVYLEEVKKSNDRMLKRETQGSTSTGTKTGSLTVVLNRACTYMAMA